MVKSPRKSLVGWFQKVLPPDPPTRIVKAHAVVLLDDGQEFTFELTGESVIFQGRVIITAEQSLNDAIRAAQYAFSQRGAIADGIQYPPHRIKKITWL